MLSRPSRRNGANTPEPPPSPPEPSDQITPCASIVLAPGVMRLITPGGSTSPCAPAVRTASAIVRKPSRATNAERTRMRGDIWIVLGLFDGGLARGGGRP